MQLPVVGLQNEIVAAVGARESAQRRSVVQGRGHGFISGRDAGAGLRERLRQLRLAQPSGNVGEIRST